MIWDKLTSGQIEALDKNILVLLNIAATEQHGSHLPVSTDRLTGEYFSAQLEIRMTDQVLILPPVGIGCSDHHMGFSGTLSLSQSTFIAVAWVNWQ